MEKTGLNQAVQFVADNVDHNTGTIDGRGTFHGMGIIASITPASNVKRQIPRVVASTEDVNAVGKIRIHYFNQHGIRNSMLTFSDLDNMSSVDDPTCMLDFFMKLRRPMSKVMPSWSGVMQTVQTGFHTGKSSVIFLPMIDLNPSDMSCVYSTLQFVCNQAEKLNVKPVLTFDQPLYWKAQQIVCSEAAEDNVK